MDFGGKVAQLRRERGWSQEQLADLLGVTRQSVSKWEAGSAMPEISKLVALSNRFGVSVDDLVRDERALHTEEQDPDVASDPASQAEVLEELGEIKQYLRLHKGYEYKSKIRVFGIPLIHVLVTNSNMIRPAKGIIAIGNSAIGVISVGGIALGLISFGGLSFGLLLAIGGLALGSIALGGAAIGVVGFGGAVIAAYAAGGAAVGSVLAVGGAASAPVAAGYDVKGVYTLLTDHVSNEEIYQFIRAHCPNIWEPLARLFACLK